jgi:hypothetical protein
MKCLRRNSVMIYDKFYGHYEHSFGDGNVLSAGRLLTRLFWRTGYGSKRILCLLTRKAHLG